MTTNSGNPSVSSVFSASPQLPVIMLLGYWPPTGTDFMLADYLNGKAYRGHWVQAWSPTFGQPPKPLGWQKDVSPLLPWWGQGSEGSDFLVDYRNTAEFFWRTVPTTNPVALLSFSRGSKDTSWNLEKYAWNYAQTTWNLTRGSWQVSPEPAYPPPRPAGVPAGSISTPAEMHSPYAGGGSDDPSPCRKLGSSPDHGNSPNPAVASVFSYPPPPPPAQPASFEYGLPMDTDIVAEINRRQIITHPEDTDVAGPTVTAAINDTHPEWLGNYVSAYMTLLVCWYGRDKTVQPPNAAIRYFGHTHVGAHIDPPAARQAFQIQLDLVIDHLR